MSVDPHVHHQLIEGPIKGPIGLHWPWLGVCKCGQQFRGTTQEDIYAKSQFHINRHNPTDEGGDAA